MPNLGLFWHVQLWSRVWQRDRGHLQKVHRDVWEAKSKTSRYKISYGSETWVPLPRNFARSL